MVFTISGTQVRIKKPLKNYWSIKYVLPIIIGLLAFLFVPFEALDSYRYYNFFFDTVDTDLSIIGFVAFNFIQTFDFIYYLLQYFCISLNIPVQAITGVSVALLYIQSFRAIDIVNKKYGFKHKTLDILLLHLFVLISVSYIAVWSLTRNQIGIMFVAYGINYLLTKKNVSAVIFFLFAIFTHFGLIFYLLIFFTGYFNPFRNIRLIHRSLVLAGVLISFIASLFIGKILESFSNLFIFSVEYDYQKYLQSQETLNVFEFTLGWGDKSMFFTTAFVILFCLFNLSRINTILSGTVFVFIWLCISLGFSQMHTQRTLLLLIPLQGIVGSFFLFENKNSYILYLYRLLIIMSVLAFIWNLWAYRDRWVFELPY